MAPKYMRGQQITIRSVKSRDYLLKYPEIEQYVGEAGTIVGSYGLGTSGLSHVGDEAPHLSDNYFYRVQLYRQSKLVTIPEEALELLESND
ncbi:hypothetical protein ACFLS8_03965 [Chloroflexota bacterium]